MKKCVLLLLSSIGLYGQWITGFYSAQNGVLPVSGIPWDKYTHIIHFAAAPNSDGTVDLHYLTQSEISSIIAARPAGKKVIVAFKDNDSNMNAFAAATSPATIATFTNNLVNFVNSNGYDGIDIDWEANINTTQFQNLLARLRSALPGKVIAMDAGNWGSMQTVAAGAASSLDQVNVMCYDMDTPGNGYTWFNDALLQNGNTSLMTCDWRVRAMTSAGLPASKVGIGIPYYGRRWPGVTQALVSGSFSPSWFPYRNLVTDGSRWQPQNRFYDTGHKANYLSIPSLNEFDSYNGVEFINDAVAWQQAQGFGGFMTFTLEYEYLANQSGDARYPLSTALAAAVGVGGTTSVPSAPSPGPVLSSGTPTGTLSPSTKSATLSVASNVNATCRYATTAGTAYSAMPYPFSVDGTTTHSSALVGLQSGTSYRYYARCQDSSGNPDTTDYPISFSVASPAASLGPVPQSVTPLSGSASSQAFTFQIFDPSGYTDVKEIDAVFGPAVGQANSCRVQYWAPTNTLFLQSDDTNSWAQATLGSSTILRNSQCSINPAASSVSGAGTGLNATLAMTFTPDYAGTKTTFAFIAGATLNSGWATLGTWTVPAAVVTGTPPVVYLTPNAGSGSSATFTLGITDGGGFGNVAQGALIIGNTVGGTRSCFINYSASTNTISLLSDDNVTSSSAAVGTQVFLQNGQCSVNAALASVTGSGKTLSVKLPVTFASAYKGSRALYISGADKSSQSSAWQNSGTWTVNFKKH